MKFAAVLHMEGKMSCTERMYHSVHCNLEKHLDMIAYYLISVMTQQETNRHTRVSIFLIFAFLKISAHHGRFHTSLQSQGDIDCSLHLPINHLGNMAWRQLWTESWKLGPDGELIFGRKITKESTVEHRGAAKAMTWINSCFSGVLWKCYSQVSRILCLEVNQYSRWSIP